MLLCPVPNRIKVPACMDGVEVDKGLQWFARGLIPQLTQNTVIDGTHELLAQDVKTMRWDW
jgi:hypothetical protein